FGEAFDWRASADVFREWTRLTAYENDGDAVSGRILDISRLSTLSPAGYNALAPVQWPIRKDLTGTPRLFVDGRFATPDGRARLTPVRPQPPALATEPGFPLSLNTGRIRDQWHTMTRTGLAPQLCRHAPEPFVEVHPEDAGPLGVKDGGLTRIVTRFGEAVAVAKITDRQRRGAIFMPMHWTDAFAPSGKANPLVAGTVDPTSGQPEFKHTPARLSPYRETWSGFLLDRAAWTAPSGAELIWRRTPQDAAHLHEFAGRGDEGERDIVRRALSHAAVGELVSLEDTASGARRQAWIKDGRVQRVLAFTVQGRLPPRAWLAELFSKDGLSSADRAGLLLGRAPGAVTAAGPVVCACRNVSSGSINAAIGQGCTTLDAVGEATGAGVTCGSCRPEIARLIAAHLTESFAHAA
ncbi:MAG: nitrate reductase, partial [Caulobacteraceae bacterium]